jgi:hypothetical protein
VVPSLAASRDPVLLRTPIGEVVEKLGGVTGGMTADAAPPM